MATAARSAQIQDKLANAINPKALAGSRYYKPELDVLRLAAFLFVFLKHGPRLHDWPGDPHWKHALVAAQHHMADAGAYGVCLFFFLSSYLITEILRRECESTGSVHLKSFYIRRILRIWPLYYAAVLLAILISIHHPFWSLGTAHIFELLLLVGWMMGASGNPLGVLWSISVEELFYAVWPTLARRGTKRLQIWCCVIIAIAVATAFNADWYNPVVHFLFFATGALVAIMTRKAHWSWRANALSRIGMTSAGLACWLLACSGYIDFRVAAQRAMSFCLVDIGCVLLFLAIYELPSPLIPRPLVYLGQISYGLYVFHALSLDVTSTRVIPHLPGHNHDGVRVLETYVVALSLATVTAAISYRYFETPFLKLKKRFEVIHTRPVGSNPLNDEATGVAAARV